MKRFKVFDKYLENKDKKKPIQVNGGFFKIYTYY